MPLYLVKWPNGDCSFISARSKNDPALFDALDEAGDPSDPDMLITPIHNFALHLKLADNGTFEYESMGELCYQEVMDTAYPTLWNARAHHGDITKAVQAERLFHEDDE